MIRKIEMPLCALVVSALWSGLSLCEPLSKDHWAFTAPEKPSLPEVRQTKWPRNEIDYFVLSRLEAERIDPSPEASQETLVRRLSFDLTGLPPTIETIDSFLADDSADAYQSLVERLLSSLDYGEHMAATWLDGARYADTNGFQNDFRREMWPWRDWVINAYNENMPFDRFTVEQIAGDLLPNATQSQRIATGFNRNNHSTTEGGSIEEEWRIENIVDRVETTATVFLGLTMGCARCHEHKFDPISQREFYEFFAFFNHTEDKGFYSETRGNTGPKVSLPSPENTRRVEKFDAEIAAFETELDTARNSQDTEFDSWVQRLGERAPNSPSTVPFLYLSLRGELPTHVDTAAHASTARIAYGDARGPTWTEGLLGPALELPGTPFSHVDLGQAIEFDRESPFTISLWVRPDGEGVLFSKTDDSDSRRGVSLLIGDTGRLTFTIANHFEKNVLKVRSENSLQLGAWSHVALTYDGTSKARGIGLYLSGVPVALDTRENSLTDTIETPAPLRLGRGANGGFLQGAISGFQYFDSVLDESELAAILDEDLAPLVATMGAGDTAKAVQEFFDLRYTYLLNAKETSLKKLKRRKKDYIASSITTVMVMAEREEPRLTYLLTRGAYDAPDTSEALEPGIPAFLPPLPDGAPPNRLGLAKWIVDPANPLSARVAVNRIWQRIFGRGIVGTAEDFGMQGNLPTHPKLLDWLATEFIDSGWDIKALLKRIVTSAAYRQSHVFRDELMERDPQNLLLARGPRFRLSAEAIRDNALAVSGLLSRKIGGPSVKPYQPEGLWAELAGGAGQGPYVQDHGEDLYRRSIYSYRKRTVPPPAMTTFDAPSWEICRVRRARTNTPLQALALLNDITYVEAARNLAQRMIAEAGPRARQRIAYGFRLATGRFPSTTERQTLQRAFEGYHKAYGADEASAEQLATQGESPIESKSKRKTLAAYTLIASILLNLDETITKE